MCASAAGVRQLWLPWWLQAACGAVVYGISFFCQVINAALWLSWDWRQAFHPAKQAEEVFPNSHTHLHIKYSHPDRLVSSRNKK